MPTQQASTEARLHLGDSTTVEEMVEQLVQHAEYAYENRRPRLARLNIGRTPWSGEKNVLEELAGPRLASVLELQKDILVACKECMAARGSLPELLSPQLRVRIKTHNGRIQRVALTIA